MKSTGHYNPENKPRMCMVLLYGKGKATSLEERVYDRACALRQLTVCEERLDLCSQTAWRLTLHVQKEIFKGIKRNLEERKCSWTRDPNLS